MHLARFAAGVLQHFHKEHASPLRLCRYFPERSEIKTDSSKLKGVHLFPEKYVNKNNNKLLIVISVEYLGFFFPHLYAPPPSFTQLNLV